MKISLQRTESGWTAWSAYPSMWVHAETATDALTAIGLQIDDLDQDEQKT